MKNIYFITPWFGSRSGGAEIYAENLARNLAKIGLPVTILTTTSRSPFDAWDKDYYNEGELMDGDLIIHRYKVDPRSVPTYIEFYNIISSKTLISYDQELLYLNNTIRSRAMESFIMDNKHNGIFFPIPYCYGVSYFGGVAALPNTVPIPCLHDEPAAWFKTIGQLFNKSKGMLFLTEPEKRLATTIYSLKGKPSGILGGGISGAPDSIEAENFRAASGIYEPFLLFIGRKVPGKGIDILLDYWIQLKKEEPDFKGKLVIIGGGDLPPVENPAKYGIADFGSADECVKFEAIAACSALCHLSVMESLSIVLLEAWSMKKPVIVNELCNVTTYQALKSEGGIPVKDYYEFKATIKRLFSDEKLCMKLGEAGEKYVRNHFTWEKTVENFKHFLNALD